MGLIVKPSSELFCLPLFLFVVFPFVVISIMICCFLFYLLLFYYSVETCLFFNNTEMEWSQMGGEVERK